tara:strand:- start:124 stop:444 length:321 start_codon:yes stop_codon:yes gene_type:complete
MFKVKNEGIIYNVDTCKALTKSLTNWLYITNDSRPLSYLLLIDIDTYIENTTYDRSTSKFVYQYHRYTVVEQPFDINDIDSIWYVPIHRFPFSLDFKNSIPFRVLL